MALNSCIRQSSSNGLPDNSLTHSVGDLQEIPYFKTGYTGGANIHFSFKLDSAVSVNNWIHSNSYFSLHLLLFFIFIRPY